LIFIDESWVATNMARCYGRAPCGERVIGHVPHGHWMTSTFIAGLRHDGIIAPCLFNCAIDGELFLAYVQQQLAPSLSPGDIVIADNLSSHKVAGVREAIEARNALLWFLPSYSPDLNPIEHAFAKLKELLRAEAPRTIEALWAAVGRLLNRFSAAECANYLAHDGYRSSG
jgi:transposase